MLHWMCDKTKLYIYIYIYIYKYIKRERERERERERDRESWVTHIVEKILDNRLRWFGHLEIELVD